MMRQGGSGTRGVRSASAVVIIGRRVLVLAAILVAIAAGCRPATHAPGVQQPTTRPGDAVAREAPAPPQAATAPTEIATRVVEETWPDGRLKLRKEVRVRADGTVVDNGSYTTWYPSGQEQYQGTLVDGRWDGVARSWHDNGQLAIEEHFRNGLREGPRRTWDREGRLRKEEHWANDQPDGVWTTWRDNGEIRSRQEFNAGQVKN